MRKPALAACLLACTPAFAAVTGEWRVNLTRSGATTVTYKGATEAAAWLACQAAIPNSGTGTYTCGSSKYVATVTTTTPTPTPPKGPRCDFDCGPKPPPTPTDPDFGGEG